MSDKKFWEKLRGKCPEWMRPIPNRALIVLVNARLTSEEVVRQRILSGELSANRGPRGYGKLAHAELLAVLGLDPNVGKEICQCCGQVIRRKNGLTPIAGNKEALQEAMDGARAAIAATKPAGEGGA